MGKETMTKNNLNCQAILDMWHDKYIGNKYRYPTFMGYTDLGDKTRGITYFKQEFIYGKYTPSITKYWGEIKINKRLNSDWRIKAVLWHEFCHHWAYSVYNYSGHQGTFDKCLRTDKKLWLLGSLSRIIPMF